MQEQIFYYGTISKKCLYALSAVFELAARNSNKPVKVRQLAGAQGIPVRFLEVILNELKRAGILESRRGKEGGYLLSEPAESISVGQIIRCVQPMSTTGKSGGKDPATGEGIRGDYAFERLRRQVDSAICEIYDNVTLAGLVEDEAAYRNSYTPNYVI